MFSASKLTFAPLLVNVSWFITIFLSAEPIVLLDINDTFWPFIGEPFSEAFNIEYPVKYSSSFFGVGLKSGVFQSAAVKITSPSDVTSLRLRFE